MTTIPVSRPLLSQLEETYVLSALRSTRISGSGPFVDQFEAAFSEWIGTKYGISCCSGTAAVHLALAAAGVGKGDRVVVPTFTMMGAVTPILQLGAIPVPVDAHPRTWTIDIEALEKLEGPFKAIVPVHVYGQPCDMDPLLRWADERNAIVIEDAAEAHGALYKNRRVGSFGKVSAFSFYANKSIACGEGGMVLTSDENIARKSQELRTLCLKPEGAGRFEHDDLGYSYRLSNLVAAIGLAQTERADELIEAKRRMAALYFERLKDLQEYIELPNEFPWAKGSFWVFGIVLKESVPYSAAEFSSRLLAKGIQTRPFFCPVHKQPFLKGLYSDVQAPVSERLWQRGLYLPSPGDLTEIEADKVVDALRSLLT